MTDQSNNQVKHHKTEEPKEYVGRQGIRCSCGYVHPVNESENMDVSRAINKVGCVVPVSELRYIPIFDDDPWKPYDCF